MSYSNGKITAPVSIDDVKTALGVSTNDVAALCTSSKINMWAKYKPTSYPAPFPSDWYKAGDGNYGLNIPDNVRVSKVADLVAKYSLANNGYGDMYKRPTGGSSSPYRLGDFRGYNHNAKPEIRDILGVNMFVTGSGDYKLDVDYNIISADGDQISYSQVSAFKNYYFGFVIYTSGGSYYTICTANETVANGGYSVPLANTRLGVGNYIAYPMFCSVKYYGYTTNNFSLSSMYLYAVPNLTFKNFSVVSSGSVESAKYSSITATYNSDQTSITVNLVTKSAVSNVYVYCVYQTNPSAGQDRVDGESVRNVGSIAANTTKSVIFLNLKSGRNYKIYVYSGSNYIISGMEPGRKFAET